MPCAVLFLLTGYGVVVVRVVYCVYLGSLPSFCVGICRHDGLRREACLVGVAEAGGCHGLLPIVRKLILSLRLPRVCW